MFLLFLLISSSFAVLYELEENSLIGQPNISCHPDTIEMRFRTKHPFTGKIYVQGHYSNPDCRVDFGQAGGADHDGRGGIRLHHGSCDMDRQRMVQPEGMQFSTVLVISFHSLFVTKTDRAFHINCMYREDSQTLDSEMTVGDVTPANILHNELPLPQCQYTIRKDNINGELLKFSRVGDLIMHRWDCRSEDEKYKNIYGMLVHNCYVEDGQGDKVQVIDERGCHKDPNVLGDPTYTKELNMAYRESYVFKFRDRIGVRFSCEIKLCVKAENGCEGITPPDCSTNKEDNNNNFQNSIDDFTDNKNYTNNQTLITQKNRVRKHRSITNNNNRIVDADLFSQYVFVLDEPIEEEEEEENNNNKKKKINLIKTTTSICLSTPLFITLFLIILFIIGIAIVIIGHSIYRQHHKFTKTKFPFSTSSSSPSGFAYSIERKLSSSFILSNNKNKTFYGKEQIILNK
ncbi:ZP domain-containing protein [Meloidogyne graminicola]|uniref:ZP domain-containing protein n=1 Tax=Meloidogyne graminicola TaxID=189291 RepID=A0A8S9ZZY1_9BILA|nr:ZP domain-containing protein [Meloidogyne graminicola]